MPKIFSSLQYANFRNYFIGHTLSTLGTWIQQVALAWLAYELTHSASILGLIAFFAMAPQLILSPLVGAIIDKINKKKALIFVQILFLIQALLLALLTYSHDLNQFTLLSLSILLGILTAIDTPLRQSFISDLVSDKSNIANALALNAMIFNACRFVGPPIAGLILALSNAFTCFIFNAFSYLFLIIALFLMKNVPIHRASGNIQKVFSQGYRFVFNNQDYRKMMLNVAVLNFTASSYVALIPIFAKDYLKGNETTLGYLWGMAGIGSLISSSILANTQNFEKTQNRIQYNMLLCAIGLLLLGIVNLNVSYYFALFLLGFGISTANVSTNIQIQQNSPPALRGRIVSIYTSIRFGFDALGGVCAGFAASLINAKSTMLIAGGILFVFLFISVIKSKMQLKRIS